MPSTGHSTKRSSVEPLAGFARQKARDGNILIRAAFRFDRIGKQLEIFVSSHFRDANRILVRWKMLELGPVETSTAAADLVAQPLHRCRMKQSREPRRRDPEHAPVGKLDP